MQRDRLPYLVLPAAALIAVLPLILHGCSCGHDFDFHILNWLEAAQQFRRGNLHPQWAFTPAYNAGEPRFIFYPPLSWTIGALLGLLFRWSWTPILYTWLTLTVAGFTLHRLARNFTTPAAALLAATFYLVNPYMLFTAYERTAYAELLAAAIIPLLLDSILRPRVTIPRIAIPVALLWLTNAPAAVMGCYALALLTLIRLAEANPGAPAANPGAPSSRRSFAAKVGIVRSTTALTEANPTITTRTHLALTSTAGTLLGLGLAAVYLIPAAYQRRYVQIAMAILPGMRIQDNFFFHHNGTTPDDLLHDQVLHSASFIAILLITLTTITLALAFRQATRSGIVRSTTAFRLAILTIAITLLLTPISAPIWNHAPELAFLQFPWRLLAILAAVLSLTLALALTRAKLKPTLTTPIAIALAAALTYPAYRIFHQPCDPEDTVPALTALFHSTSGTEPTDEYTPITADNDSLAHANPPYWLALNPTAPAPPNTNPGSAPHNLAINSPFPQSLILNLRDYPTWRIQLNHSPITTRLQREDGLIAIPIPAGTSHILITYAPLPDQTIGTITSAISLIILLLLTLYKPQTINPSP